MNRLVFSRTKKVRKSYSIDERMINTIMEIYGINKREAIRKYQEKLLYIRMRGAHLS